MDGRTGGSNPTVGPIDRVTGHASIFDQSAKLRSETNALVQDPAAKTWYLRSMSLREYCQGHTSKGYTG